MTDFTLSLALFDFLPVLFTGLAVYWIACMAQGGDTAQSYLPFLGAALVFVAGALKATWNLAMVFALISIAQVAHKSIALHWFEEALTTFGAASFAVAAYRLYQLLVMGSARRGLRTAGLSVAR